MPSTITAFDFELLSRKRLISAYSGESYQRVNAALSANCSPTMRYGV